MADSLQIRAALDELLAVEIDMDRVITGLAPHWGSGWRPKFWSDAEVRRTLTLLHRRVTILQATDVVREIYGAERAASKSAIARYWKLLDKVPAAGRSSRVSSPTGGPSSASPQLAAAKAVAPSLPQAGERVALPSSTIGLAVGLGFILFEIALVGAVFFFLR